MTIALAIGFGLALGAALILLLRGGSRESAEAREETGDQVRALTAEALRDATTQLIEQNREQRESDRVAAEKELQRREAEIKGLTRPMQESLARIDTELADLGRKRAGTDALISDVRKSMETLGSETANLKKALRQPHVRGNWGEVQLRRCVEIAGMTEHVDFELQETFKDDDVWLRPDANFLLPGGRNVVADSKVPMEAYLEAHEAEDEAERKAALRRHASQASEHIRKLGSKRYQDQFRSGSTPDFVVCFFPSEPALQAAFEADPGLYERALDEGVLIATPATLVGLLRTIELGWRQERMAEEAQRIGEEVRLLHQRFPSFLGHLAKLGRAITTASSAWNDAIGSLESRILPQLRKFEELGAGSQRGIEPPERIESSPRPITAPELDAPPRGESPGQLKTLRSAEKRDRDAA